MITLHRRIRTTTGSRRVFEYLADFRNAEEWDGGTITCELISGVGEVGSRYRNVSRFAGRQVELVYTLMQLDPTAGRLVLEGRNATTISRDIITVTPAMDGSLADYRAEFTLLGPARLLGPLLRLPFARLANRTAAQLERSLNGLSPHP